MTTPPWLSVLSSIAAFLPFINTVEEKAPDMAWPQPAASPRRAAGRLLNSTSGEPDVMAGVPCPGMGQEVGSLRRAAGLPDMRVLLGFVQISIHWITVGQCSERFRTLR